MVYFCAETKTRRINHLSSTVPRVGFVPRISNTSNGNTFTTHMLTHAASQHNISAYRNIQSDDTFSHHRKLKALVNNMKRLKGIEMHRLADRKMSHLYCTAPHFSLPFSRCFDECPHGSPLHNVNFKFSIAHYTKGLGHRRGSGRLCTYTKVQLADANI